VKKVYVGTLFVANANGPWWASDDVRVKVAEDAKVTDESGKEIGNIRRVWNENGSVMAEMEFDLDPVKDTSFIGGPWSVENLSALPSPEIAEVLAQGDGIVPMNFD
jgi:hypothetical protein